METTHTIEVVVGVIAAVVLIGLVVAWRRRAARRALQPPEVERAPETERRELQQPAAGVPSAAAPAKPSERTAPPPAAGETAPSAEPEPQLAAEQPAERAAEAQPQTAPEPSRTAGEPARAEAEAEQAEAQAPAAEDAVDEETRHEQDVAAIRQGLATTRGGFVSRLAKIFRRSKQIDPAILEEVEEVLITADIGVKTADRILEQLRTQLKNDELKDTDSVWTAIREQALDILRADETPAAPGSPHVILVVGVNGVGKTTTIGKLASKYQEAGKRVLLAAGDTFRAAAVLQLEVWGRRVGCPVVRGKENADPGAVIFDAIKQGTEQGVDVIIADTAGRLHTKTPLMEELKKVDRTVAKALGGRRADEVLLVLDSTTGQNAVQQAHMFREALDVSGIVLTKLDGTAKGGVILGIVDEHRIPVRYIGLGERVQDLREFDAALFVEALFSKPDDETLAA